MLGGLLKDLFNGAARMSEDALSRAERINRLLAGWQRQVAQTGTDASLRVIDLLAANPFLTIKGAAEKLEVAFTTAQRAVQRLQTRSIVGEVSQAIRDGV